MVEHTKKRIAFRIPIVLHKALTTAARSAGIPKSKLLINWISSTPKSRLLVFQSSIITNKRVRAFHFYVSIDLHEKISSVASELHISISTLLVRLIAINTKQQKTESECVYTFEELFNGYMHGENYLYTNLIRDKTDNLSPGAKIIYGGMITELGFLSDAKELYKQAYDIDIVKVNPILNNLYLLCKARTYQLSSDFIQSQAYLNKVRTQLGHIHHDQLLSFFYILDAYQSMFKDNFIKAIESFEKALELFSSSTAPYFFVVIYAQLAVVYTKLGDRTLANYYENRLFKVIDKNDTRPSFANIFVCHVFSRMYILQGRLDTAKNFVLKSTRLLKNAESPLHLYVENQIFGMLALKKAEWSQAKYYFENCERVSKQAHSKIHFPYHEFFLSFIRSKYDYASSIQTYQSLINKYKKTGSRNSFMSYMLYTTQYLHSNDASLSQQGFINLKKLNDSNPYRAVLDATTHTLSQKQFQVTL